MSMLERFNDLTHLTGFSKGFYDFFKNFRVREQDRAKFLIWRSVALVGEPKCDDFGDYVREQCRWIEDFRTQGRIRNNQSRQIFFEAKKRIHFFITELELYTRKDLNMVLMDIRKESMTCIVTTEPFTSRIYSTSSIGRSESPSFFVDPAPSSGSYSARGYRTEAHESFPTRGRMPPLISGGSASQQVHRRVSEYTYLDRSRSRERVPVESRKRDSVESGSYIPLSKPIPDTLPKDPRVLLQMALGTIPISKEVSQSKERYFEAPK
jgi:hypothetical protein